MIYFYCDFIHNHVGLIQIVAYFRHYNNYLVNCYALNVFYIDPTITLYFIFIVFIINRKENVSTKKQLKSKNDKWLLMFYNKNDDYD